MKKYVLFIGIDISKYWIDVALSVDGEKKQMLHRRFANQSKGFNKMLNWLLKSAQHLDLSGCWLFCMEHTGVYTMPLCCFLQEQGFDYVLDSALRIKRSLGIKRGKDDKADAKDIAYYVYIHHKQLKISTLPTRELIDLKNLLSYRDRLLKQLHSIKVAAKETQDFIKQNEVTDWMVADSQDLIAILQSKIKRVEAQMRALVKQNLEIKKVFDLATSVKGIGLINALQIIVHTNCFKAFESARQFACYIGIAPFHKKSGNSLNIAAKVSPLGHKKLKALLTNSMLSAIQNDKELKAYYERKVAQGKIKYKVFNAVKNKLIARVFATVKRGTPFIEIHNYA